MAKRCNKSEYKNDPRWPGLSAKIGDYVAWLGQHGRSPKRCAEVGWRLEHVFAYLRLQYDVMDPRRVTPEMVQWFRDMKSETCTHPNGVRAYCQVLGHFCFWATGYDPWDDLTTSLCSKDMAAHARAYCKGIGFDAEFAEYIDRMTAQGLRRATIWNRVRGAVTCIRALQDMGRDTVLSKLDDDDLNALRNHFSDVKEVTLRCYMGALGLFCLHVTGRNPYKESDINWNSADTVNRKFIFTEEWYRLLDVAHPNEYLVLMLGGGMGLRSGEIAGIRMDDIDGSMLTVRGKGHGPLGKVEVLEMPPEVMAAIDEWLPIRQAILEHYGDRSEGHLLVNLRYRPGKRLSPSGIGDMINYLGNRADVDLSPHSMRRLFATTLYDCGTDLVILRTLMRHAKIDTTLECYIHADPRKVRNAQENVRSVLLRGRNGDGVRGTPAGVPQTPAMVA